MKDLSIMLYAHMIHRISANEHKNHRIFKKKKKREEELVTNELWVFNWHQILGGKHG